MLKMNKLGRWFLAAVCTLAPAAMGQEPEPPADRPGGGLNPDSFYGKDPAQGVYVRESTELLKQFELGQRMERGGEWTKASIIFQELLDEKYRDRVVPSQVDKDQNIYQYIAVAMAVQDKLIRWPDAGLAAYRARFEPVAARILEQAPRDDMSALSRVFRGYFITMTGMKAGIRLLDLYLLEGEFVAAAWYGETVLSHPTLGSNTPAVMFKTALAYHLAGNERMARAMHTRLVREHPAAEGRIAGKNTVLADALRQVLETSAPVQVDVASDSWPIFGGSEDRGRVSGASGRPGPRLFGVPFASLDNLRPDDARFTQMRQMGQNIQSDTLRNLSYGVQPAISRGELFFQDGQYVYGISLDSGLPLPGWAATYPGEANGRYALGGRIPIGQQLCVTVTEDHVLLIAGMSDSIRTVGYGRNPGRGVSETRLICLDRTTGRHLWTTAMKTLPEELASARGLDLTGAPLLANGRVFVGARGGAGQSFEDAYVVSFDLASGALQWACYVASANTGPMGYGVQTTGSSGTCHISYSSGRLYVLTNLGALASVDAFSGTIHWLTIYPREQQQGDPRMGMARVQQKANVNSWSASPPVLHDGRIFILPLDATHLMVYDANSGLEVKRIKLADIGAVTPQRRPGESAPKPDEPDTLLAVVGDMLITSGQWGVQAIDWKAYDNKFNPRSSKYVFWPQSLPEAIRGRGVVTTDGVFVSTDKRLLRIGLKTGKIEQTYPRYPATWEGEEGPGNILVTDNHVVVATRSRVNVMTDLDAARKRFAAEISALPNDPEPRLRYSEVLFVAGAADEGMKLMDEALELMGGLRELRPGPTRDRAFNLAMTFAVKIGEKSPVSARAADLFERASHAAQMPAQQVSYRFAHARNAVAAKQHAQAVELLQQVLANSSWRVVVSSSPDGGPAQAATVAEEELRRIIAANPQAYEPVIRDAAAALNKAMDAADPDALLEVATRYPNSPSVAPAMIAAAGLYEQRDRTRDAVLVLRQLYLKMPENAQRLPVLEAQARNYLKLEDGLGIALGRLTIAAQINPRHKLQAPMALASGEALAGETIEQVLASLRRVNVQQQTLRLPDAAIPIPARVQPGQPRPPRLPAFQPARPEDTLPEIAAIPVMWNGLERGDRLPVFGVDGMLRVLNVGSGIAGLNRDVQSVPLGGGFMRQGLAIWNARQIIMLSEDGNETRWNLPLGALPPAAALLASAGGPRVAAVEPDEAGNDVIIDGNVVQIGGRLLPGVAQAQDPVAADPGNESLVRCVPLGSNIIAATSAGRLLSIDATSGKVLWQTSLAPARITQLRAAGDFVAVQAAEDRAGVLQVISAYDGQYVYRVNFPANAGLVNYELAADGTLVFLRGNRLSAKDLFAPSDKLLYDITARSAIYNGMSGDDHLKVSQGRVLVATENGTLIRVHALDTGKELTQPLQSGARDRNVSLRTVGSQLYAVSNRAVMAYNLDDTEQRWWSLSDPSVSDSIADAIITRDYLLVLERPVIAAGPRANVLRVKAYARYPASETTTAESGRLDHMRELTLEAGIVGWRAADGGLLLLGQDSKLRFFRGGRPVENAAK